LKLLHRARIAPRAPEGIRRYTVFPPLALAPVLLLISPSLAGQQTQAPSGPTIGQIHVTGNHHFPAEKIIAASGLRSGAPASKSALDEAASLLGKTGAFSEVGYQYRLRGAFWDAEFQVVEATRFAPCSFDNFLWFSDADLLSAVARDVPLFDGALPEGGGMSDEISAALDRFLHAHQMPGSVAVRPSFDQNRKLTAYSFHISGVPMPVLGVQVTGGPLDDAAISQAARGIVDHDYSRSASRALAQTGLTMAYQDEGYWQPIFSEPAPVFRDPAGKDASQGVMVTYSVSPGLRYTWAGASWSGTQSLTAEQLNKLVLLSPGDIARRKLAEESWDAVRPALARYGFLTAATVATPQFDDKTAAVHFNVLIQEGPQFRMGELRVDDPSERVVQIITSAWPLERGQIFDLDAAKEFGRKLSPSTRALVSRADKRMAVRQDLDLRTNTVNVLIKFE